MRLFYLITIANGCLFQCKFRSKKLQNQYWILKTQKNESDEVTESEKALFKYITYTVTEPEEVTIFDEEVLIDVKLKNKNMGEVLVKYFKDALIYTYIKGTLEGFLYEGRIKQVIIDEAQDYNRLQYIIINNIFKKFL